MSNRDDNCREGQHVVVNSDIQDSEDVMHEHVPPVELLEAGRHLDVALHHLLVDLLFDQLLLFRPDAAALAGLGHFVLQVHDAHAEALAHDFNAGLVDLGLQLRLLLLKEKFCFLLHLHLLTCVQIFFAIDYPVTLIDLIGVLVSCKVNVSFSPGHHE